MKPLLNSRLRPPEIQRKLLQRPQLTKKLAALKAKQLVVVEAGAGQGKTTAAVALLTGLPAEQWGWLSLAPDCNHLTVFWGYLLEALEKQLGDRKDEFLHFFHGGLNQRLLEDFLVLLCNRLAENDEIYLFLDDFHVLTNQEVLAACDLFLASAPSNLHLLLLTRQRPSLYLARLELQNQLCYLAEADLLLTEEEALQFIQNSRKSFNNSQQRLLLNIAAGWIGGLQLLLAADLQSGHFQEAAVSKENQLLSDYLAKEIFQQLAASEQDFLVKTAYFPYFDPDLCRQVLPTQDFKQQISGLLDKNLLLNCIDSAAQIYQYHPLLKDFLCQKFQQLPVPQQQALKRTAAAVFAQQGSFDDSIQLLLELKDYPLAMEQINDQPKTMRSLYYMGEIPLMAAVENIDFAYQKIFYHYSNLEYDHCLQLIAQLLERYPAAPEIQAIEGIKVLLGLDSASLKTFEVSEVPIDSLQLNAASKAFILLKNAMILYYQDQFWEALKLLETSEQLNRTAQNPFLTYFNQTLTAQLYEEIGELNQALGLLQETQSTMSRLNFSPAMTKNYLINFQITITGIHLKQLNLQQAEQTLWQAANHCNEQLQAAYLYNQAEFFYLTGQPDKALAITKSFEVKMPSHSSTLVKTNLIKYCLKQQQLSQKYLDDFITNYWQQPQYQNLNNQLFYSMVLLQRHSYTEALTVIDSLLKKSRQKNFFLKTVEGCLLKATILLAMNHNDDRQLQNLYGESLYYACENKIKAPFYLYQETVVSLQQNYGQQLIATLGKKEQAFHQELLEICGLSSQSLLTPREKEVLAAIAAGASNKTIAQQLFISHATVKTHILNIYRKLEVNSRVAAVEKAHQLQLL